MFRMNKDASHKLCGTFMSKIFLLDKEKVNRLHGQRGRMAKGYVFVSGGFISPKTFVAFFLRMLAGGMLHDVVGS